MELSMCSKMAAEMESKCVLRDGVGLMRKIIGSEMVWLERVEALWFDRRHCGPLSLSSQAGDDGLRYSLALLDEHFVVRGVVDLIAFLLRPVPPARGRFEPRPLPMGGHHCGRLLALLAPPLLSSGWRLASLVGWLRRAGRKTTSRCPLFDLVGC